MKKKFIILIIISLILIFTGVTFSVLKLTPSNVGEEVKKEPKELRKILEEEISHDTAKEIIQFYLDKDAKDEKIRIATANILANNINGEYLVRLEFESNTKDAKDTTIQYLEDGKWKVEFPLRNIGDIPEKFTEFWAIEE